MRLQYCRQILYYYLFPTLSPSSLSLSPVATDPTIVSLVQVSATTVRVEWSQPSGGASVIGYTVHYSDGSTDRSMSAAASSTSTDITGLTNGRTYFILVEATTLHLSGESTTQPITLCECFYLLCAQDPKGDKETRGYVDNGENHNYCHQNSNVALKSIISKPGLGQRRPTQFPSHFLNSHSDCSRGCECD